MRWSLFAVVSASPLMMAMTFPEAVVRLAPASISARRVCSLAKSKKPPQLGDAALQCGGLDIRKIERHGGKAVEWTIGQLDYWEEE